MFQSYLPQLQILTPKLMGQNLYSTAFIASWQVWHFHAFSRTSSEENYQTVESTSQAFGSNFPRFRWVETVEKMEVHPPKINTVHLESEMNRFWKPSFLGSMLNFGECKRKTFWFIQSILFFKLPCDLEDSGVRKTAPLFSDQEINHPNRSVHRSP